MREVKKETGISRDKVYRYEKSKTKSENNLKQDQTGTEGVSHFCHLAKMGHLENQGESPKQNPSENFFFHDTTRLVQNYDRNFPPIGLLDAILVSFPLQTCSFLATGRPWSQILGRGYKTPSWF